MLEVTQLSRDGGGTRYFIETWYGGITISYEEAGQLISELDELRNTHSNVEE